MLPAFSYRMDLTAIEKSDGIVISNFQCLSLIFT